MRFDESYLQGEYRDGFYVSSMVKRSFASQMEVLEVVDRICKSYGIKYFADWGTMLGTVRHHGFVPWDDDIDICMLRDDYEKFCDYCIHHQDEMKPYKLLTRENEKNYPYKIAFLIVIICVVIFTVRQLS